MGYINEPKGVDFIIQSDPLDDDTARKEISDFIRAYKANSVLKRKLLLEKRTVRATERVRFLKKL